jgi:biotin carboxylase
LKTLLLISGGIEAVPGIQRAKEMGLFVVVSDGNPNAPGFGYADDQIIASTYDVNETSQKAKQYHETVREFNGVICIASDVPMTVASVAKELSLPTIPLESAELAMDKLAMKNKFNKDKVPIPDFIKLDSFNEFENLVEDCGYPLVIKPVDSRGARGVLRLTRGIDLNWAWNHSKDNSPTGRVMAEKYLDGPQVSTESMMINGECYTVGFADRNYEFLEKYAPYIIENGGDLPSQISENIQKKVKDVVKKAALSMGIRDGVVKGDIVILKGKPFIIELAARLSGGYFCTHAIPLNTGVDFVGNAIKMAIGEKVSPDDLIPKFNKNICQRYIFPAPGLIKEINGLSELEDNSSIKYFNLHASIGQKIDKPTAHPSRAGMVITEGNSRQDAIDSAIKAINSVTFTYKN